MSLSLNFAAFNVNIKNGGKRTMIRTVDYNFEVKGTEQTGSFSGYASTFHTEDAYGDIMAKGAFSASLQAWKAKGQAPAMLWQHDAREPIGVWLSLIENEKGLLTEGQLNLDTQRGREAYSLLKMGALRGLSIGFNTKREMVDPKTRKRTITEVDLWEISPVTFPANPEARIDHVRMRLMKGEKIRHSDVENILLQHGFSHKQAREIASHGLSATNLLHESEAALIEEAKGLLERVQAGARAMATSCGLFR